VSAFFATTMLPAVALAPLAGWLSDRVESTRLVCVASLAQAALAVALAQVVGDVGAILALSALLAAGSALSQPAEFALVPVVAPRALARANGIVEAARYAGYATGPLVAAAIAAASGPQLALLVDAASFLAIAAAARLLQARRAPAVPEGAGGVRACDGVKHLWADRVVRTTVLAATSALLCISASLTVEVFYIKEVLGAGDVGYAVLTVAWMVGMVAGAYGVVGRVPAEAMPVAALVALGVQGAGMAAQTAWLALPVSLAAYVVGGTGHGVKNALMRTLIQVRVPAGAHGRAFAAYNAARNTAELAALAAGGLLVGALGARTALLLAGLGPVLASIVGLLALRAGGRASPRAIPAYHRA
jgi:MFS family permease